jgi:hypothetical protein
LILPAATAMTIPCMAPISSSEIFCALATPREYSIHGWHSRAMAAANPIIAVVRASRCSSLRTVS